MTDRPLRLEYLDPAELAANPLNPKFHPTEQLATLSEFMGEVGWAGALLFNERTGRLLDGHGRRDLFAGRGPVPVLVGSWDETRERKILAFLDSTGWMAKVDARALELLSGGGDLLTAGSERFGDLLGAMRQAAEHLSHDGATPPADRAAARGATKPPRRSHPHRSPRTRPGPPRPTCPTPSGRPTTPGGSPCSTPRSRRTPSSTR
jgi:hypothetical protein